MKPIKITADQKQGHRKGGFGIEVLYPGLVLGQNDTGIGAIGRIDHAHVSPGTVVPMHPHRDDEILSYMREGRMVHTDTVGNKEELTNLRMMMMNAGHSFQHEERMAGSEPIKMLQIFLRPRAKDLEPRVQFHDFETKHSHNVWRLLAAPRGEAPLEVRADVWVHDASLRSGEKLTLPPAKGKQVTRILYAFAGTVSVGTETVLTEGESLIIQGGDYEVVAHDDSDIVLFTTDTAAPVFKGGMFSGNMT
jgi:redox-sensitive bicupin YhaK (pirin superfamily)